jgi:Cu(I)/Ag(I) efflux system membrane fusion protein
MPMKNKQKLGLGAGLILALGMIAWGWPSIQALISKPAPVAPMPSEATQSPTAPALGASLVKWVRAENETIKQSVVLNGKLALNGNRIHQVSARLPGRIDRLNWVEGMAVESGQPIAWLYSPEYISAQNELLLALRTVRALEKSNMSQLLADAQATLEGSRQKLKVMGANDSDIADVEKRGVAQPHLMLRAPISGRVIKRNVDPGGYLDAGASLGTVADLSTLWFIGHVFDADLPLVRQGQRVEIKVNGVNLGAPLTGTISFISPTLDPDTHAVPVRVDLNNPGGSLKPEMFARAELILGERLLPVVPRSAVVQDGAESFVMVQRGGTPEKPGFVRLSVQTVPTPDPAKWAIVSGVSAGEAVVVEGGVLVERDLTQTELIRSKGAK